MELRKFSLERYKGYAEPVEVELAPLTVLVGANNSGKTALAQAIQLLAGAFAPPRRDEPEPIPLRSGGIRHGETFEDLVTGRTVHGDLRLSAVFLHERGDLSFSATVRNVVSPTRRSERQISDWSLRNDGHEIVLQKTGFDECSPYRALVSGAEHESRPIAWDGLLPRDADGLAPWVGARTRALESWGRGIRHLQCPRHLPASPFTEVEHSPSFLGSRGEFTPQALAADDDLKDSVRDWYRRVFGVSLDVVAQGAYSELVARTPAHGAGVRLAHSGRGLSHVLPVAVTAFTAGKAGPGVDFLEHPEAELHPAAHADIAELLLESLPGSKRPLVIETHSEMVLLRARRWVAEGRLPAGSVLVYWVHAEPGRGSILRRIEVDENGELSSWPDGVFIEDYEEVLAIRRAARRKE